MPGRLLFATHRGIRLAGWPQQPRTDKPHRATEPLCSNLPRKRSDREVVELEQAPDFGPLSRLDRDWTAARSLRLRSDRRIARHSR
jgi:hypothetical protein